MVAGADNNLRLLLQSPTEEGGEDEPNQEVRMFGGGLSGHHKRINDVCFCSSKTYETHVASIADDGLILWNLYPSSSEEDAANEAASEQAGTSSYNAIPVDEIDLSVDMSKSQARSKSTADTLPPEPTAYSIKFSHPLHTISSHPLSANQFMVSDSHGKVFLIDWTELDLDNQSVTAWRGHRVVELVDPRAVADSLAGGKVRWSGGASWKRDDINL